MVITVGFPPPDYVRWYHNAVVAGGAADHYAPELPIKGEMGGATIVPMPYDINRFNNDLKDVESVTFVYQKKWRG